MTLPLNRLTPRSRKVLLLAAESAEAGGQHYIGTEHLLWAVAIDGVGVASQVLEDLGVRQSVLDAVRGAIDRIGPSDNFAGNEADQALVALDVHPNHALLVGPCRPR
jgi:ATP-dependent Clp protease ATP-binding subunit ClpA